MEEATHLAWVLVIAEAGYRYARSQPAALFEQALMWLFTGSYVLCIAAVVGNLKDFSVFQSSVVRNVITFLHALDGVNALMIGLGMYYGNIFVVAVGLVCMTKLFLLYLLSRMVTGVKTFSKWSVIVQTTKTFLHHVGSFLFLSLSYREVILVTALWRFVSMNGHAAMTLKKHISPDWYHWVMWKISHMRNLAMAVVLILCLVNDKIRDGFALSACGHLAYLLVRLGPVFRIGSLYFPDEEALDRWARLTDRQRVQELVAGKHPYFALELGLLLTATVYFSALRIWWLLYRQ